MTLEDFFDRKKTIRVFSEIISALEKQTPKKVAEDTENSDGISKFCPMCGCYVGYIDALASEGSNYCPDCGQALDWSEEVGKRDEDGDGRGEDGGEA